MQSGRGGMGMHKHGATGWKNGCGKSPRLRLAIEMEARKNVKVARKTTTEFVDDFRKLFGEKK